MKSYTVRRNLFGSHTNNISVANLAYGDSLMNDSDRYLSTKYFLNERSQNVPGGTIAGTQSYDLPYNIKQLINVYITVGTTRYTLTEAPSREFWDSLNFVPYTSDIPQYFFIYNKKCLIFPSPSSSALPITYNYKVRIRDLSQADYTAGTVTMTNASSVVTGSGTTFIPDMVGRWIQVSSPNGDNNWYEIGTYTSATVIGLVNQYQGLATSNASYTIGEMSIVPEDYQDLPIYRAASIYFTTRVVDPIRSKQFMDLYKEGFEKLNAEFGSKTSSVAITPNNNEFINPNLFTRSLS